MNPPEASTPIIDSARYRKCLTSRFYDYRPAKSTGTRDRWHADLVCANCHKLWWLDQRGGFHDELGLHKHRRNVQQSERQQRKRANRRARR